MAPDNCKTETARLWTYVRDDQREGEQAAPAVWFADSEIAEENIPSSGPAWLMPVQDPLYGNI